MKKTINLLLSSGWFMILVVAASVSGMFTIYNQASTGAYFHHAAADNGNNGSNASTGGGTGAGTNTSGTSSTGGSSGSTADAQLANANAAYSMGRIINWHYHCTSRWPSKETATRRVN